MVLVGSKGIEMHSQWQIFQDRLGHKLKKISNTDPDYQNSESITRELMFIDNITKSEIFAII